MKIETLVESVVKQGFDEKMVQNALINSDLDAIDELISQLNSSTKNGTRRQVLHHLLDLSTNCDKGKALDVLGASLKLNHHEVVKAVRQLSRLHDKRAITHIRTIFDTKWKHQAATVFIEAHYHGDAEEALLDETEVVRYSAVKQLERDQNTTALLSTLEDESAVVRRISTWYMGRRQVEEAVEPLIELVQAEEDAETLRGIIWSLGVLRDQRALPYIDALCQHEEPLIAASANEALQKLVKAE